MELNVVHVCKLQQSWRWTSSLGGTKVTQPWKISHKPSSSVTDYIVDVIIILQRAIRPFYNTLFQFLIYTEIKVLGIVQWHSTKMALMQTKLITGWTFLEKFIKISRLVYKKSQEVAFGQWDFCKRPINFLKWP